MSNVGKPADPGRVVGLDKEQTGIITARPLTLQELDEGEDYGDEDDLDDPDYDDEDEDLDDDEIDEALNDEV